MTDPILTRLDESTKAFFKAAQIQSGFGANYGITFYLFMIALIIAWYRKKEKSVKVFLLIALTVLFLCASVLATMFLVFDIREPLIGV
jgi:4-amino-4-deoxy-L-arabinose transferase-like glycosyltransferase